MKNKKINIQIDKGNFTNKGAELMLRAVMAHCRDVKGYNAIFVYGRGVAKPEEFRGAGMCQIPEFNWHGIALENRISGDVLQKYGLVKKKDIHVLLDAGGFQFGDQWVKKNHGTQTKWLEDYYKSYKKNGTKIIFLPQAMGPFNSQDAKNDLAVIVRYADLIFVRDDVSYKAVRELHPDADNIQQSTDFTNLLEVSGEASGENGYCFVPNSKMVTHTDTNVSSQYLDFMTTLIEHFANQGERITLLNHEGPKDRALIDQIKEAVGSECDVKILDGLSAEEVKQEIKKAKMLVSSRFHGVVSGLCQGIPTFCTSWNHKYEELLKDYDHSHGVLDVSKPEEAITLIQQDVADIESIRNKLLQKSKLYKDKTKAMWEIVDGLVFNY